MLLNKLSKNLAIEFLIQLFPVIMYKTAKSLREWFRELLTCFLTFDSKNQEFAILPLKMY